MLVLSRHQDEKIMLGDDIVLTIVAIRGDKVRIGIEAPANLPVHRQEVYEAIQRHEPRHQPVVAEAVANVPPSTMAGYAQRVLSGQSQVADASTDASASRLAG